MNELNNVISQLGKARNGLMGISILFVVLYHMYCWISPYPILKSFKWGFIGVDVFLLVSGFGLCRSYERNSLKDFYLRRFFRIFPLHVIERFLLFLVAIVQTQETIRALFLDFILRASTLSYWVPLGNHGPWFVPSIVFLYFCFPVIYKVISIVGMKGVLVSAVTGLFFSFFWGGQIGWYYDCLIARLPIFFLGIVFYQIAEKRIKLTAFEAFIWGVILILSLSFNTSRFFRATMCCPVFILVIFPLLEIHPLLFKCLDFIGKHSFELFLGSEFSFAFARYFGVWKILKWGYVDIPIYLIVNAVGFYCFFLLNKIKWLKR